MYRNKIIYGMLIILAFSVLGVLYKKTSSNNDVLYTKNVNIVRDLQKIDSDWNAQALKSHAALNKNFDDIANILPQLRLIRESLSVSELATLDSLNQNTKAKLDETLKLLDEKEANIERFKSARAIMRNSIHFLPIASKELISLASETRDKNLVDSIRSLISGLYSYVLLTDNNLKEELNTQLLQLIERGKNFKGALKNSHERFSNHAGIILKWHQQTIDLLEHALKVPTNTSAENVLQVYDEIHKNRVSQVEIYRLVLIAYSTLLLIALGFIGVKLSKSYRDLNKANELLVDANETLEEKVENRTKKLKESQLQLVQSEKMAAIGQMVAGVAHEINTPLGYVNSNIEIIQDIMDMTEVVVNDFVQFCELINCPDAPEENLTKQIDTVNQHVHSFKNNSLIAKSKGLLDDSKYGLKQIDEIVVNLKEFSRKDRSNEEEFNVNDGLESAMKIAYNTYKHHVQIIKQYSEVPNILCSPSQINQVFLNIITNASHAIEKSGKQGIILIKTAADKDNVYISIKDNGTGMPEEVQQHIFEPFYTTKEVGKGTGLGMSISHNIIEEHKGSIKLISKVGVGTNFLITLPIQALVNSPEYEEQNAMIA